MNFLYQYVILNGMKNLNTLTCAFQILRDAQDDTTKRSGCVFRHTHFFISLTLFLQHFLHCGFQLLVNAIQ